jgi:hypothetical protein
MWRRRIFKSTRVGRKTSPIRPSLPLEVHATATQHDATGFGAADEQRAEAQQQALAAARCGAAATKRRDKMTASMCALGCFE